MQQKTNMPPASHDPFEQLDEDAAPENAHALPDDDHGALQRGMPGRNLRTWGVVALGVVVIAALMWPRQPEKSDKAAAPAPRSEQSIADELASRAKAKPDDLPPPVEPVRSGSASQATTGAAGTTGTSGASASANAKGPDGRTEDERAMMILASPMSVDVELRNKTSAAPKKQSEPDPAAQQLEMMRAAMAGLNGAGATQGADKAAPKVDDDVHGQFLSEAKNKRAEPPLGLFNAHGRYSIYEGTLIRTVLTRSLHTDLPGKITAKVMSDVYDSVTMNTLLIPRGSEVTCSYQSEILVGQEVVLAACERLRLPNGKSFSLAGTPASDMQGAAGLPAEVNNHFWKMFKTTFMLGAASLLLPKEDRKVSTESSYGQSKTSGSILSMALYETVQQVLARNSKIKPTASVEIGTPFTLTIARDVEMEPYLGR